MENNFLTDYNHYIGQASVKLLNSIIN